MSGKYLICCLLFLFLLLATQESLCAEDPAACVEEIGIAIDAADPDTFQELVNIDNVLAKALDAFVNEARKPENAAKLPPLAAMLVQQLASPGSAGDGLRALVTNEITSFVLHGIGSGSFGGKRVEGNTNAGGFLAPMLADASTGRKEIKDIGAPHSAGKDWLVPFVVHDYGNGRDYPVVGRLVVADNGLRLSEIDNIIDLLTRIANESQELETVQ